MMMGLLALGWLFARLVTGAQSKLVGTGFIVRSLVETAFVADDFSRVEGGAAPAGGLCGPTVETLSTEVLGLL